MYKLTVFENTIQRLSDNAFIPTDPLNRDYQEYLDWVAQGNEPEPYVEPPLTLEQIYALRQQAYQNESDPIKVEAEYDAMVAGVEPDYTAWIMKVQEIKDRYPLPEVQ